MANKPNPYLIDSENPEWNDEDFKVAKKADEVLPTEFMTAFKESKKQRGKQIQPVKKAIYIKLDADLVDRFRSTGRGWQTRLNHALKSVEI